MPLCGLHSPCQPFAACALGCRPYAPGASLHVLRLLPACHAMQVHDAWATIVPSCPQLYLYSEADVLVRPEAVEAFMAQQVRWLGLAGPGVACVSAVGLRQVLLLQLACLWAVHAFSGCTEAWGALGMGPQQRIVLYTTAGAAGRPRGSSQMAGLGACRALSAAP